MSHISEAAIGGKFRAVAAAALDGVVGGFGDADLLCVSIGAGGEIVVGTATICDGVIWTREGRSSESATPNAIIGGRTYTVFTRAQIAEMEVGAGAFSAGDAIYARAAGDATAGPTGGAGAKYVGVMTTDNILVVDVGLRNDGTA